MAQRDTTPTWWTGQCRTGKRCFPSRKHAKLFVQQSDYAKRNHLSSYHCRICNYFHIGHRKKDTE